jgi:phytoene dehydrogenase-like protein
MSRYDTIILGSSVDALVAASYLARSGASVLVLEPGEHFGGAMATAEFAPGFKADLGLMSGRIDEQIVKDLKLEQHGLEVIERNSFTALLPEGKSLTLGKDRAAASKAISAVSAADSARYGQFMGLLDMACELLKQSYLTKPSEHPATSDDLSNTSQLIKQLRGYGSREMTEILRLLVMPIRDLLNEWFESNELKGLLAGPGIRALNHGPFAGSTTFNLLHHIAIGDGYFRATARGGVGAICAALATAAKSHGATLQSKTGKFKVILKDGAAAGVKLESGEEFACEQVISDYDARHTFRDLVDPVELEPEFNRLVTNVRYNGCVARVNLALNAMPAFQGIDEETLRGTLTIGRSINQLEKAFDDAKYGGISKTPYLEMTLPSLTDPSLAPSGKHVMSIWMQYAPFCNNLTAQAVQDLVVDQLTGFAPDLRKQIQSVQVLLPSDFESRFNLSEGHLYGSDMTLTQAFYLRPVPGFARYRSPIDRLHLCGSATHPGGGISGLSGRNAASEIKSPELALSK